MKRFFFLILSLCVLSVSALAADQDSHSFYDVSSVLTADASLLDYAVMPLAATSWDTTDQTYLKNIRDALVGSYPSVGTNSLLDKTTDIWDNVVALRNALTTFSTTGDGNIAGWVQLVGQSFKDGLFTDILDEIGLVNDALRLSVSSNEGSLLDTVGDIETLVTTGNTYTAIGNGFLERLVKAVDSDTYNIRDMTQQIWSDTDSLVTTVGQILSVSNDILTQETSSATHLYNLRTQLLNSFTVSYKRLGDGTQVDMPAPMRTWIGQTALQLGWDGVSTLTNSRTLYSRIRQMQEVLASDDDLALANSQKNNRQEIEDSFLTGSSGGTSLGASDFGALSDVGGTIKDSISLNGQSDISDFTSGLFDADTSGQGWFSDATKNALDAVSSTASYDLRSDPYNMSGWQDRYAWLEGDG